MLNISFVCLQSSHEDIHLLGHDSNLDSMLFKLKRKLVLNLHDAYVSKVSLSMNKHVEALCYSKIRNLKTASLGRAILQDGHLHRCSFLEHRVYQWLLFLCFLLYAFSWHLVVSLG